LAIVEEVAQRHGGHAKIDRTEKGARISIIIPLDKAEATAG